MTRDEAIKISRAFSAQRDGGLINFDEWLISTLHNLGWLKFDEPKESSDTVVQAALKAAQRKACEAASQKDLEERVANILNKLGALKFEEPKSADQRINDTLTKYLQIFFPDQGRNMSVVASSMIFNLQLCGIEIVDKGQSLTRDEANQLAEVKRNKETIKVLRKLLREARRYFCSEPDKNSMEILKAIDDELRP